MKIFFIGQKGVPALRGGGVEKHVESLALSLVKLGHDVFAYTRPNYIDRKIKSYKGVNLISLPSIGGKNLDAISHTLFACLNLIFRKTDIIHFHSIGPSSLIWLVRLFKPNTPIISTFHSQCYHNDKWGSFARRYLRFGEKMACKKADKVIVVSKPLGDYVKKNYPGADYVYLPNGVNRAEILEAKAIKEKWGLEKGSYLISVSRLVKNKGLELLVSSFRELNIDKKLVIVGGGDLEPELKRLAGNDKRIIFTGVQAGEALAELFSNAYLFVQSSESEGLSISLLEAMSYGLPCIVSDIEANLEAVDSKANTFKNANKDSLKRSILAILNKSDEVLVEEGKELSKIVYAKYYWPKITEKIEALYKESLGRA